MGVGHYENFPVASLLLPAPLRPAVRAIYRFARTADDVADEGDADAATRLAQLQALGREVEALGQPGDRWPDLAVAVAEHGLDRSLLHDLLSAFSQDVTTTRYPDFAALLDYCRRSANPIGRLLLALYRRTEPALLAQSDAICSGLQLTNFWQDVAVDLKKDRVYLPADLLARHGCAPEDLFALRFTPSFREVMREAVEVARTFFHEGLPLARALVAA